MPLPRVHRSRYSSRPFLLSTLALTVLTTYALLLRHPGPPPSHDPSRLLARAQSEPECREVHQATDQCAFVRANCGDDEPGLIHYLTFYYCTLGGVKSLAFAILVTWLGLLFTTIGIAASDFFSVNLSTIAGVLGLSESLAGVTFLAFGNGSPDVFSTFAAMGSNSGSMAVGELIGAAGFITAVVAGSMALVREFRVSRKTFVRDIVFFIFAVSFTMVFLADGQLYLWECMCMIAFYLFYVVVVVGWHWWTTRRRRMRLRDAASRGHYNLAPGHAVDELESYRDEVDDDEPPPVGGRSASVPEAADLGALEAAPRIEVDGVEVTSPPSPDDEDEVGRQVAAEMTSSMRVMRPRWGRSNTTITPIRPSLVGALEFRSILTSLQKARNMKLTPLPERPYSDNHTPLIIGPDGSAAIDHSSTSHTTRERALSSGNVPLNLDNSMLPQPGAGPSTRLQVALTSVDGKLAPYARPSDHLTQAPSPKSRGLQLQIPPPSPGSSAQTSPSLSPFPMLSESPADFTPTATGHSPGFALPSPVDRRHSIPGYDDLDMNPKPVKWWPYNILPAPHVIYGTLFPTLQGWREKTVWDKIVSLISVPSILLLVITLPVVETERDEGDGDTTAIADPTTPGLPGNTAPPVSLARQADIAPETEWQEYRRRARSNTSRTQSTADVSPLLIAVDSPSAPDPYDPTDGPRVPTVSVRHLRLGKPSPDPDVAPSVTSIEEDPGWSRWLVALQIFIGPLFVVLILWANIQEDMERPVKSLLRMILYSLLASLCLLSLLLLTTAADRKPKYHFLLCFLGFIISVAWISTVAGEVVGVLKAFGVILGISEAILGLTIFAVGNSLGDLVADVTVARLGYPVMALAACFGGPMLNILLGVGIGGAWMTIRSANDRHKKEPESSLDYQPYRIQVGGTLLVSAITVLLTLIVLLIVVPSNRWIMSRKIGWGLIAIWSVSTIVNLVLELTGSLYEVS